MSRAASLVLTGLLIAAPAGHLAWAQSLDTPAAQYSYAIGTQIGGSVAQGDVPDLDIDALVLGLRDVLGGVDPKLTEDQIAAAMTELQNAMQASAVAAANKALADGQAFLEENKGKDGITTTESGLQYRVENAGDGDSPKATDTVSVHYEGRLLDGSVFDSSYERGAPATFGVTQVIPGWTEALQLMKPGAKWEVWLPSDIAYGERGAGGDIGPNEVLNFTIELIEIAAAE
ncbi:MAG: FKBP-type peptidyl-prolyl cis-trans isomerase [Pseudomonadota bacterium]